MRSQTITQSKVHIIERRKDTEVCSSYYILLEAFFGSMKVHHDAIGILEDNQFPH